MTIVERLLARCNVNDVTGCWEWTGAKVDNGYGGIKVSADGKRELRRTHRLSYELFIGPIPEGVSVCHTCDVPHCINPVHLFLGTTQDNMDDMVSKGRQAIGDRHGCAKLTSEKVKYIRERYSDGGATLQELGNEVGVTAGSICRIVRRKTWIHVQ